MSRLTNFERDNILDQEIIRKFDKQITTLRQEIIKEIEKQQEAKKPKWITPEIEESGYLSKSNCIRWPDREPYCQVKSYKNGVHKTGQYFPMSNKMASDIIPDLTKTLEKKVVNFNNKLGEKQKFRSELRTILYSITTWKSLVEVIPELKEYMPQGKKSTALVPFESIQKIRKQLKR